jgi:hypothetical protein
MSYSIKSNYISVPKELNKDNKLLELLEVPKTEVDGVTVCKMNDIKKQILEDRQPGDLITNTLSRLCVFEQPTAPTFNPIVERGWIEVDIYVQKDKNKIDRRVLIIAERIIELLDTKLRMKNGLKPIDIGAGLYYHNRMPDMMTDNEDWTKYGLVFKYDYINL